jgi:hypothetical protein
VTGSCISSSVPSEACAIAAVASAPRGSALGDCGATAIALLSPPLKLPVLSTSEGIDQFVLLKLDLLMFKSE